MKNIVICGSACSGKDFLKNLLVSKGYLPSISETTRPPRANEIEGRDYYYISEELFKERINSNYYLEYCNFNGWYYGTPSPSSKKVNPNLYIMTPGGIYQLPPYFRSESLIIYLDIPESVRRERFAVRSDNNDSIERRILADNMDFENFTNWNIRITDSNQINL